MTSSTLPPYTPSMNNQTKNRTIEWLLTGLAFLLALSWMLQATPFRYVLSGLFALLAIYVLLHGVEHSLRAVAAWCMSWAEGIAHRKKIGGKWQGRLGRRQAVEAVRTETAVAAGEPGADVRELEIARAV